MEGYTRVRRICGWPPRTDQRYQLVNTFLYSRIFLFSVFYVSFDSSARCSFLRCFLTVASLSEYYYSCKR
jgi:hypothetical protein